MSTVTAKIQIEAPIDEVWDTVMNPDRLGEWVTIHRGISGVSGSPLDRGSTMDQSMCVRGFTFKVHWTLAEVEHPHRAVWDGAGPAHSRARIEYTLNSDSNGCTVFEYTNEFHPPGGRLGNVAGRMIVGGTSEREAKHSLSRLKSLLEKTN
jgi:uncharacterized protein YndB with AHSA1/START domain